MTTMDKNMQEAARRATGPEPHLTDFERMELTAGSSILNPRESNKQKKPDAPIEEEQPTVQEDEVPEELKITTHLPQEEEEPKKPPSEAIEDFTIPLPENKEMPLFPLGGPDSRPNTGRAAKIAGKMDKNVVKSWLASATIGLIGMACVSTPLGPAAIALAGAYKIWTQRKAILAAGSAILNAKKIQKERKISARTYWGEKAKSPKFWLAVGVAVLSGALILAGLDVGETFSDLMNMNTEASSVTQMNTQASYGPIPDNILNHTDPLELPSSKPGDLAFDIEESIFLQDTPPFNEPVAHLLDPQITQNLQSFELTTNPIDTITVEKGVTPDTLSEIVHEYYKDNPAYQGGWEGNLYKEVMAANMDLFQEGNPHLIHEGMELKMPELRADGTLAMPLSETSMASVYTVPDFQAGQNIADIADAMGISSPAEIERLKSMNGDVLVDLANLQPGDKVVIAPPASGHEFIQGLGTGGQAIAQTTPSILQPSAAPQPTIG